MDLDGVDLLIDELKSANAEDANVFCNLLNRSVRILGWDELVGAREFSISRPTWRRWGRGVSAPHPIGRKAVFKYLIKQLEQYKLPQHMYEVSFVSGPALAVMLIAAHSIDEARSVAWRRVKNGLICWEGDPVGSPLLHNIGDLGEDEQWKP